MNTYKLIAISGSLRAGSYNTALLRAFAALAPEGVSVEIADIKALPLYNQDDEKEHFPEAAAALKQKIREADGILIATPEYNRSLSGVLKNALDWTSRPYGDNAWVGKPVYAMSCSSGNISGALAQYDLKKVLLYLNAHVLGQPEFFCGHAQEKFNEAGELIDEGTKQFIGTAYEAFTKYIDTLR